MIQVSNLELENRLGQMEKPFAPIQFDARLPAHVTANYDAVGSSPQRPHKRKMNEDEGGVQMEASVKQKYVK